jgi:DNA repair photolyase
MENEAQTPAAVIKGRGSAERPAGRFEPIRYDPLPPDPGLLEDDLPPLRTRYLADDAQTVLVPNDSPDIPCEQGLNPYRGCEHGCIYCYARPTHEYVGLSAGLDFESVIFVKRRAAELLRAELAAPRYMPRLIGMCGVTDPYQPIERHLRITRGCLEVLAECRHPVSLITKSALIVRDLDLLQELHRHGCLRLHVSLTTLDAELARKLEPRAAQPARRLQAIERLAATGLPVCVLTAPIIPGLTDEELPSLLRAAAAAGAHSAGYIVLRLPHGVGPLFEAWLERHFPARRERVLARVRHLRGGELNDSRFGSRMKGEGLFAELIANLFATAQRQAGLDRELPPLVTTAFRRPADARQPLLF